MNLDYTKQIHPVMIRTVFLKLELYITEHGFEIPEYVVQDYILISLLSQFKNTEYTAKIETQGKFDCVVSRKDTKEPLVFYELKTYLKNYETINIDEITSDIEKIRDKIRSTKYKGYFILVIARKKLKSLKKELFFIQNHVNNIRDWISIGNVKIRPSQKEKNGRSIVLSWEIQIQNLL